MRVDAGTIFQPHRGRMALRKLGHWSAAASCITLLAAAPLAPVMAEPVPVDLECEIDPACAPQMVALMPASNAPTLRDQANKPHTASPAFEEKPATVAEPVIVEQPVIVDEAAIAERDARMFDTLTTQTIAQLVERGLENDGETTAPERSAAEAFYAARDHRPLFLANGTLTELGEAVMSVFASAETYGLNADDFAHDAFIAPDERASDTRAAAQTDIAMTLWAMRYARHAQTGRVNPASISPDITMDRNFVDPQTIMPALLAAEDPSEALLSFHPQHAQFHALRARLAELREASQEEQYVAIPEGGTLRLGDSDERVPLLRDRLRVPAPSLQPIESSASGEARLTLVASTTEPAVSEAPSAAVNPLLFDEPLDEAVRAFQADHNLTVDGIVGPATFAALNEKAGDLVPHLIANMERWRWMPRDLGRFHVIANVPEYRLWVMQEGESIFSTRTIVGRNRHRTAIFSDEMEYLAVNPYWNVPRSITRNELLPNIIANPGYLPSRNYEVLYNGRVIDPYAVNWEAVASGAAAPRIRQRPGPRNALGEIKFMFPNQHAIYFHDTPSRGLFGRDQRAFSHGCVRVQDPWAFAEALLENEPNWSLARLQSLKGPREQTMLLDRHIPVHIAYFTSRIDDDGDLIMSRDLYGHHARVLAALGLDG